MAELTFDDLIPKPAAGGRGSFEDLIPSFRERLEKPVAPLIPSITPDQGSLWPVRKSTGEFDPSAGVLGSLLRAITTPGDILRGTIPTPYSGGAAQASPDVISRAGETANLFSPASPSYRAGVRYGKPPPNPAPPSAQAIKDAANAQFTDVRRSGWEVPSSSVEAVERNIGRELGPDFTSLDAPKTYGRLASMADPAYSSTSISELMSQYDGLSKIISMGGADAKAANLARERVAEMINNLPAHGARPAPGVTPTMTSGEVASTLQTARDNTRSVMSANRISGDLDPAVKGILETIEAKAQASGNYNIDAPLRNRALAILQDNANVAALRPDEKAALEAVVQGTMTRNRMRDFGRIFGVGNPLELAASGTAGGVAGGAIGALMSGLLGSAVGGPIGAVVLPAVGTAARGVAKAGTKSALSAAEELMRSNSPLAQEILANLIKTPQPFGRDEAVLQTAAARTLGATSRSQQITPWLHLMNSSRGELPNRGLGR